MQKDKKFKLDAVRLKIFNLESKRDKIEEKIRLLRNKLYKIDPYCREFDNSGPY